jgi:hypothetical protein
MWNIEFYRVMAEERIRDRLRNAEAGRRTLKMDLNRPSRARPAGWIFGRIGKARGSATTASDGAHHRSGGTVAEHRFPGAVSGWLHRHGRRPAALRPECPCPDRAESHHA